MRYQILKLLKEKAPAYVSGEEMAKRFAVSRTAVWKNIQSLKADGYLIEGSSRLGYRLAGIPDLLIPEEIMECLQTELIGSSREKIHYYKRIDSSNSVLKKMAETGAPEGTVVLADEQTQGRGRLGRFWLSPFGKNIYLSILLKPPLQPQDSPLLTLLAAVAAVRSIRRSLPNLSIGIKWPNDVLINNRKVCGILTELKAEADLLHYLIIGIGINVNWRAEDFPAELKHIATSLYIENSRRSVSRQKLLCALLQEMESSYRRFLDKGPQTVISAWKKYNLTLGKNVTVHTLREDFTGYAVDIDSEGALLVKDEKGILKRFHSGDVTLKKS